MKEIRKKIRKVIQDKDPKRYEEAFNEMANKLAEFDPEIQDVFENGRFTTVFTYEEKSQKPETAKDRCLLDGEEFYCRNCPHLELGTDKRVRKWPCPFSHYGRAHMDSGACNVFYTEYLRGEIKPREEGEIWNEETN